MPDTAPSSDVAATDALAALRGRTGVDPVRLRFLEALARRARGHVGAARQVLDERIARHVAACEAEAASRAANEGDTPGRIGDAALASPLGALVDDLRRRRGERTDGRPAASDGATTTSASKLTAPAASHSALVDDITGTTPPELEALQFFRETWARLSVEQRLAQSRTALPGNAGPLNSHHLVHRALTLMRAVSPDYLERFVTYADALLWLEQTAGMPSSDGAAASRGRGASARGG